MEELKSLTDRLKLIKLQSSLNAAQNVNAPNSLRDAPKDYNGNSLEEYPKLRQPKLATLLKVQAHQRKADTSFTEAVISEDKKDLGVSLRQEFLNKKEKLEKAAASFLKKYEINKRQVNLLDDDTFSLDYDEAQPLTFRKELDLQLNIDQQIKPMSKNYPNVYKKNSVTSLNFCEQLLVNIFYTKVHAHPNGFFAENLPDWYKRTFDKDVTMDWLELLQASNKFHIEKVQNKIVLYTKNINEDPTENIYLNASCEKPTAVDHNPEELAFGVKEVDMRSKSPAGFVRFKHLHKSLEEYGKIAGRYNTHACNKSGNHIKPNNKFNKKSLNKK